MPRNLRCLDQAALDAKWRGQFSHLNSRQQQATGAVCPAGVQAASHGGDELYIGEEFGRRVGMWIAARGAQSNILQPQQRRTKFGVHMSVTAFLRFERHPSLQIALARY